jgi:hypothetical protein
MRADLTAALRERDRDTARVLRTVLSAIANAEAQPAADGEPLSLRGDGPIAGASDGLGSADVVRRELTVEDLRAVVRSERDECLASAADLEARGGHRRGRRSPRRRGGPGALRRLNDDHRRVGERVVLVGDHPASVPFRQADRQP